MKKMIAQSLKNIVSGSFNNAGSIVVGLLLVLLVIVVLLSTPALLIWGLQLMGFEIALTLKSWFGAMVVMTVMRTRLSSGSSKSSE